MRITSQMVTRQFNQNIQRNNQAIYSLQQQIASGKKYEKISDNPLEAMKGLKHRSSLAQIEQYQKNAQDGIDRLTAVDDALGTVTEVMQRIRELTVQASSDTYNEADRKSVAVEIRSLKEQLVTLANTTFNGGYLFSGMDQSAAPVKDGMLKDIGLAEMNWDIGQGVSVNVNVNAGSVFGFDVNGQNLLQTLDSLVQTLDPATIIDQPDSGMNMTLNQFWQSLQDLSKQPDNMELRSAVIKNGQAIIDNFKKMTVGIAQSENDLSAKLSKMVDDLNASTNQVAALNQQISLMTLNDIDPTELTKQRDQLLDKLSKMVDLQVTPNQNGMVNLSVGGQTLVDGASAGTFTVNTKTGTAKIDGLTVDLKGFEVKGLLDSLSNGIPTLRSNMDLLANGIAEQMNAIHAAPGAMNLNGQAGELLFFVDKNNPSQSPKDVASMIINPDLENYPERLAAAKSPSLIDGTNAQEMADIPFKPIEIDGSMTTITDFYQKVIGQLGRYVQGAESNNGTSVTTATQGLDNLLAAIDSQIDNVLTQRSSVGAKTNLLEMAANKLDQANFLQTKMLSKAEDTDIAKAYMELSTHQTALQASLASGARIMQQTLVDFLK